MSSTDSNNLTLMNSYKLYHKVSNTVTPVPVRPDTFTVVTVGQKSVDPTLEDDPVLFWIPLDLYGKKM